MQGFGFEWCFPPLNQQLLKMVGSNNKREQLKKNSEVRIQESELMSGGFRPTA
jgi:hypothetical protein